MTMLKPAPRGDLKTYQVDTFTWEGSSHEVYRKGSGPAVLVLAELPGISPDLLGFADRVVALGCTAVLPSLFGTAGREGVLYAAHSIAKVCIDREFNAFASGQSAPVTNWLRALAAQEHVRCGGPGVGVVGMCFTGGFALAMAADAHVLAPVLSQPSLPIPWTARARRSINCSPQDLAAVKVRCDRGDLRVLALRFEGDPYVPRERFAHLRDVLGEGFVAVELAQADGNPASLMPRHHSVLTHSLIDNPGEPTRNALDRVLELLRAKLLCQVRPVADRAVD